MINQKISSYESSSLTRRQEGSSSSTYTMRRVFVNPDPCCHPVTTTTASPVFRKPRVLPNDTPCCTRTSTSFDQSLSGCSILKQNERINYLFK